MRGGMTYEGRRGHGRLSNEEREGSRPRWSNRREWAHAVAKNGNGPHASDGEKRKSLCLHCFDRTHRSVDLMLPRVSPIEVREDQRRL